MANTTPKPGAPTPAAGPPPVGAAVQLKGGAAILAPVSAFPNGVPSNALILLPSFFVFLLVQCFFVRYLVGLGNPTALYTLIFFTGLSMRPGFEQSLAHQAPAPGSMAPLERASS